MDFKTQTTSQQPQPAQSQQVSHTGAPAPQKPASTSARKLIALAVTLLTVVVVVVAVLLLQAKDKPSTDAAVETGKYQAVFMTNGQVYFGKLANLRAGYTELTDVYYLQVQQSVQPSTSTPAKDAKAAEQPQVSLTKLGNELHGPTDKMHISSDQILFWENLKDDSTVVKAITDYKAKQN